jgi:hypothetical protein
MNRIYALLFGSGYQKHGTPLFRFLNGERFSLTAGGLFHLGQRSGLGKHIQHGLMTLFDQNFSWLELYQRL